MDLKTEATALQPQLIAWRRDFHRHPELAYKEVRTSGIVAKHLGELGMEVQTGVGKTGVVGVLDGVKPGPVVMLRFDMDALPIQELNQTEYVSENAGVMHACGHDAHTAIGMGIAQIMAQHRDDIAGTLKFVFQPAEEGENGALAMIRDGVLNDPAPEIALGLHVWNEAPVGMAQVGAGGVMAAAEIFNIKVQGKGTHGAQPHRGVDSIVLAASIVNALQTVVARNVDPRQTAVVTVGTLHAGIGFQHHRGFGRDDGHDPYLRSERARADFAARKRRGRRNRSRIRRQRRDRDQVYFTGYGQRRARSAISTRDGK